MLKVTVPSRIHFTLLDLGLTGYRRNGGVGFSITAPAAQFEFEKHPTIDLSELKATGFSASEIKSLTNRVLAAKDSFGGTNGILLKRRTISERHIGLGVGTSTALACVEALCLLNEKKIEPEEIVRFSGRGGTSGIGVHGYFSGGFIFDVGRRFDSKPLLSSDDIMTPPTIPLAITQMDMPDWPVGLFHPPGAKAVSLEDERNLFSSTLPLTPEEVYKVTYHAVFGIVAAVADQDFDGFCSAINAIQECSWKQHEIKLHGPSVQLYLEPLRDLGCSAVGMSSVGPTLYFFSRNFESTVERIKQRYPNASVLTAFPSNTGRLVNHA
ncbi:hypothetical protein GN109_06205 [Collimonas pratensis]|uniref:beta-ribofuranosylaminobenzene 5'-phosphate synthase family protein n=1 Tax=Collimonas pratensis TaxID=279113 RepID=UPI00143CD72C|nr:beta-ribofuranosylaminobenzene 5'-phosphate synthase family protein [Collimonas pratensis]NKI69007.1 hypothetical protein [Collimonas pratensis]